VTSKLSLLLSVNRIVPRGQLVRRGKNLAVNQPMKKQKGSAQGVKEGVTKGKEEGTVLNLLPRKKNVAYSCRAGCQKTGRQLKRGGESLNWPSSWEDGAGRNKGTLVAIWEIDTASKVGSPTS